MKEYIVRRFSSDDVGDKAATRFLIFFCFARNNLFDFSTALIFRIQKTYQPGKSGDKASKESNLGRVPRCITYLVYPFV